MLHDAECALVDQVVRLRGKVGMQGNDVRAGDCVERGAGEG